MPDRERDLRRRRLRLVQRSAGTSLVCVQAKWPFETVRSTWLRARARRAAKRRHSLAWGVSPRTLDVTPSEAAKRRQGVSAQDKPLVVVQAMPLKQIDKFLAVACCAVVLLLLSDVRPEHRQPL